MTDRRNDNIVDRQDDDLELIISYLNKQLDPERVAQVARRLEEDPEFRELAAPMLLVWSIPKHLERHPRPPGELEKHWDEFTRRAGFAHQRQKARRRNLWIVVLAIAAIGLSAFAIRDSIRAKYSDLRDFESVPADTGWITLRDSSQVRLAAGTRLRSAKRPFENVQRVKLLGGEARFRVVPPDIDPLIPGIRPLAVETRGGTVATGRGEFTVVARGDTTDVHVHQPPDRRFIGFLPLPTSILLDLPDSPNPISVREGQRARLVRGHRPVLMPGKP